MAKQEKSSQGMSISLGMDQTPPFWQMHGLPFQQFCRDIVAHESNVDTCDQYGTNGKTDFGIDLLAPLKGESGILVAQCKAYKSFPASKIKNAADAFFKHWAKHWQDKEVKHFILIVGCDLSDTAQYDELAKQRKRFASRKITFGWWSASTLVTKLQPYPEIVQKYCGPHAEHWVKFICGELLTQKYSSSGGENALVNAAMVEQLQQLTKISAEDIRKLLDLATRYWKDGELSKADSVISDLRSNTVRWQGLEGETKSQILCLQGQFAVERHDLQQAKELSSQANEYGKFPCLSFLRGMIALEENQDIAAALELDGCNVEDRLRLGATIKYRKGCVPETLASIEEYQKGGSILPPDLWRLKAICFLLTKEINSALNAIDRSLEDQPNSFDSKLVASIIRYYSAISNTEIPRVLPSWPTPIDWYLVKEGDEARKRLAEATDLIKPMLENPNLSEGELKQLQAWYLAILCIDTNMQEKAEEECRGILNRAPCHEAAITWGIARKFDIDYSQSEKLLRKSVDTASASINQVLLLVLFYISKSQYRESALLLDSSRLLFDQMNASELWKFWKAQVLIRENEISDAIDVFGGIDKLPIQLLPLLPKDSIEKEFADSVDLNTLEGKDLLEFSLALGRSSHWEKIASVAFRIVSECKSAQSVRLGAEAFFQTERYQDCLTLLRDYQDSFKSQILPSDLQILEAECYQSLGMVNDALRKAEQNAVTNPSTYNLLNYAKLLQEAGNIRTLLVVARKLLLKSDLTSNQAIRLANAIHRDDPEIAKQLWKQAIKGKLNGEYVAMAFELGYRLNLEKEPTYLRLFQQIQQLASSGSDLIKAATVEDISAAMKRQREANESNEKAYKEGSAMAEILCDLSLLYRAAHKNMEERISPIAGTVCFGVHEDRPCYVDLPTDIPPWNINADISAIMMADKFQLLDLVLETFGHICIPLDTIQVLTEYRRRIPLLPSDRKQILSEIIKAVDSKTVSSIEIPFSPSADISASEHAELFLDTKLDYAKNSSAFLVEYFPLARSPARSELDTSFICNLLSVFSSIHNNGLISTNEYNQIVSSLPATPTDTSVPIPPINSILVIPLAMLESLAKVQALPLLIQHFNVQITFADEMFTRRELTNDDIYRECDSWISTLMEKISSEVESGRIRLLPKARKHEPFREGIELQCLHTLILLQPSSNDVIWIDDRFVNGYLHQENGIPIISIWEILRAMSVHTLSFVQYNQKLLELRQSNVRYLPILSSEIQFHFKAAQVIQNEVVETSELNSLRQYLAACLSQDNFLQKKRSNNEPIQFLAHLKEALVSTWDEVWSAYEQVSNKVAKAEYLLRFFFADYISLCLIESGEVTLKGLSKVFGELLFTALVLFGKNSAATGKQYLKWLYKRVMKQVLIDQPELSFEIAQVVKHYVFASLANEQGETRVGKIYLFQWWYENLPASIRNELTNDNEFLRTLEMHYVCFGSIHGLTFVMDKLEKAVSTSMETSQSEFVETRELGPVSISAMQISSDGRIGITISHESRSLSVFDDEIQFLFNKPHFRRAALVRNRHWIDIDNTQFESIASNLAYLEPASVRITKLEEWENINLNRYYQDLAVFLKSRSRLSTSDFLPPNVLSLINHFGLQNSATECDFDQLFSDFLESNTVLAGELLIGIPLGLNANSISTLTGLSSTKYKQLVKQLVVSRSPLARIQLLKVLNCKTEERAYSRLRRVLLRHLLSTDQLAELEALITLLKWICNQFGRWNEAIKLPWEIQLALAWLHTNKLFEVMMATGLSTSWIKETFDKAKRFLNVSLLNLTDPINTDAMSVDLISAEKLFLTGILSGVSESELIEISDSLVHGSLCESEGEFWPMPKLLRLPSRTNTFNSFLGMDFQRVSEIIEAFACLKADKLTEIASFCISKIDESEAPDFWWLMLHSISPYPECSAEISHAIKNIIRERGFGTLVSRSRRKYVPIVLSSLHCAKDPELRETLIPELKSIVTSKADMPADSEMQDNMLHLACIEACIRLCNDGTGLDFVRFNKLMVEFIESCPSFCLALEPILDDFWNDLPHQIAQNFWTLRKYVYANLDQFNSAT